LEIAVRPAAYDGNSAWVLCDGSLWLRPLLLSQCVAR
jgi:hypothetical protein